MSRGASPWPPPVLLVVIVGLVGLLARADELTDRVEAAVCLVSKRPPSVPAGKMVFCPTSGTETSCCLPFHDARLAEAFEAMTDTGLGCLQSSLRPDARYNALHSFLCAACAPDQVKDRGAFVKHDGNGTITYRLCRRFAETLWGDGTLYDACGLVDGEGNLVVPSVDLGDVDALIEMFAPDFAPFSYVIVDDSSGDCFAGFPSLTSTAPAAFPQSGLALTVAAAFAFIIRVL